MCADVKCDAGWALTAMGQGGDYNGWPAVYVISEHISQSRLRDLYAKADAFVLPSRWLTSCSYT